MLGCHTHQSKNRMEHCDCKVGHIPTSFYASKLIQVQDLDLKKKIRCSHLTPTYLVSTLSIFTAIYSHLLEIQTPKFYVLKQNVLVLSSCAKNKFKSIILSNISLRTKIKIVLKTIFLYIT